VHRAVKYKIAVSEASLRRAYFVAIMSPLYGRALSNTVIRPSVRTAYLCLSNAMLTNGAIYGYDYYIEH